MRTLLLALDPGPHTGAAIFVDDALLMTHTVHDTQPRELYRKVARLVRSCHYAAHGTEPGTFELVVETFYTPYGLTNDGVNTIELIGYICGLAYECDAVLTRQRSSQRIAFHSAAKKIAPHRSSVHARAAIEHGLAYQARK